MEYIAYLHKDKGSDYGVSFPDFPGCITAGKTLEEARKRNLLTVALLGYDGGEIVRRGLVDWPLVVRSDYIPRIQEVQASVYHIIRQLLEIASDAQN